MTIPTHIQADLFKHPLMSSLNESERDILSYQLSYQELASGEVLFEEGSSGSSCYLILKGAVLVSKRLDSGSEQTLATLGEGELLGQIALIDHKPRSATCRGGQSGAHLVHFNSEVFERLYSAQNPFAFKVIDHVVTDLSKRLRGANQQLSRSLGATQEQKKRLSFKAAQVIAGHRYTDEELDSIEVITTEFEQAVRYSR